jgi:hypothetical protein
MTALLLLFVFFGMIAGYVSTRMYKMFGLTEWKKNTITTVKLTHHCTIVTTTLQHRTVTPQHQNRCSSTP